MFHVGQKVVCVNAAGCYALLAEGSTYIVAAVGEMPFGAVLGTTIGVKLVGVGRTSGILQTFAATRFRPLTDTSISDVLAKTAPRDSNKWDNRRKVREKA
jgi:hypothetical protein